MDMRELEVLAKETRILIDDLNHLVLALGEEGCLVEFELSEPLDKIDSLTIKKIVKL